MSFVPMTSVGADITSDLVAHWRLDETSGTPASDSSGNSNTGTLVNGPTWTTGKVNNALGFDGANDYVSVPNSSHLNFGANQGFTFAAWVRYDGSNATQTVFRSSEAGNRWIIERRSNGVGRFQITSTAGTFFTDSTTTLNDGSFHHIVARRSTGGEMKVFVNGQPQGTPASTTSAVSHTESYRLGSRQNNTEFFNGVIDDVRIYGRALTDSEVSDLYNAPTVTPTPEPDVTGPIVSITSPVDGSEVSGTTTVSADASDNVGVAGVQFKMDGSNLGSEDTSPPYSVSWDTTTVADGSHTLTAVARDAAGNTTTSSAKSVNVANTTPVTSDLVAHWKLDETSGTSASDSSGNSNTGTLVNGPTWTTGKVNNALGFDGANDYVSVPNSANLNHGTGAFTISAWIKYSGSNATQTIARYGTNQWIVERRSTGVVRFQIVSGTTSFTDSTTNLNDGHFHHIVARRSPGGEMKVFVNGQPQGIPATNSGSVNSSGSLRLGTTSNNTEFFNGVIDDVRIYGRALTDWEVSDLFTAAAPSASPSPTPQPPSATKADHGGYRPHYQGYGVNTPGGRGGTIYRITNLNDSGPGSLRAALEAPGPRIVICEVSGTITLANHVTIDDAYLTLALQTCPSPGLTVKGTGKTIYISTHDVVIQHLRFRGGDHSGPGVNQLWITEPAYNVVLDHSSITWGTAKCLSFGGQPSGGRAAGEIAVIDSIIAECLAGNAVTEPGTGWWGLGILSTPGANGKLTYARNIVAHNGNRNPLVNAGYHASLYNNLVYDWFGDPAQGDNHVSWGGFIFTGAGDPLASHLTTNIAAIGNVFIPGPNTAVGQKPIKFAFDQGQINAGTKIYLSDNSGSGCSVNDPWNCVFHLTAFGGVSSEANTKIISPESWHTNFTFNIMPNANVQAHVVANAGARPLDRDSVDARIIADVTEGNGDIINSENEVGGFPVLAQNARALTIPSNPNAIAPGGTFRTNIEVWLEQYACGLEPACSTAPSPTSDTTPPTIFLTSPANGSELSGTVTISADASDDVGVAGVQFKLDGANLGSEEAASPYSVSWNTTTATKGSHTLTAVARDTAGNTTTSAAVTVTVNNRPLISNVQVSNITDTTAKISWITDVPSTAKVNYGLTSSYTIATVKDTTLKTSHAVTVGHLDPNTAYHYQVESTTSSGITAVSSDRMFSTAPSPSLPVISSVQATNTTTTSATIAWITNVAADSRVEYGFTTSYGSLTPGDSALVTSHNVTLSGLATGTLYHYRVKSSGSVSIDRTFTTQGGAIPDTTAPAAISNFGVDSIGRTSLTLSWAAPGDDGGLGQASAYIIKWSFSPITEGNWATANTLAGAPMPAVAGTTETYTVIGLLPNTSYHFAIRARDEAFNTSALSNVVLARTKRQPPGSVKNVVVNASDRTVSLNWSTPDSADGDVKYAILRSTAGGVTTFALTNQSAVYDDTSSNFADPNVTNDTTYYYSVFAYYDKPDYSHGVVITGRPGVQLTTTSVGGGGGGGFVDDPPGPVRLKRVVEADGQVLLEWTTPIDSDFAKVLVVQNDDAAPANALDGRAVFEGAETRYLASDLQNGRDYFFAIYALDLARNHSTPIILRASPKVGISSFAEDRSPENIAAVEPYVPPALPTHSESLPVRVFTRDLNVGMRGDDVRRLQELLATDASVYPQRLITGYYGPLTHSAVRRFQSKYSIAVSGILDDTTRRKLEEIFSLIAPAHAHGRLIRVANDPRVFLVTERGFKRWIPTPEVFRAYGFLFSDVTVVSEDELAAIPEKGLIRLSGDTKVYKLEEGARRWIVSPAVFDANRFNWTDIVEISQEEFEFYDLGRDITEAEASKLEPEATSEPEPFGAPTTPSSSYRDGTLLEGSDSVIYYVEAGRRRPFQSVAVFELLGYRREHIKRVTDSELDRLPIAAQISSVLSHPTGTLVRLKDDVRVFVVTGDTLSYLSLELFMADGYDFAQVISISKAEFDGYIVVRE